jgi:hypothetical protein
MSVDEVKALVAGAFPVMSVLAQELNMMSILSPRSAFNGNGAGGDVVFAKLNLDASVSLSDDQNGGHFYLLYLLSEEPREEATAQAFGAHGREPAFQLWNKIDKLQAQAIANCRRGAELQHALNDMRRDHEAQKQRADVEERQLTDRLSSADEKVTKARQQLECSERKLAEAEQQLEFGEKKLAEAEQQLEFSEKKLAEAKQRLEFSERKLAKGEQQLEFSEKKLAEAEQQLESSERKLAEVKQQLAFSETNNTILARFVLQAGTARIVLQAAAVDDLGNGRMAAFARWYYGLYGRPVVGRALRVSRRIVGRIIRIGRRPKST